ncbi:hypothetical protein BH24ACT1_BH24ACT1_09630 [soil metagenome]
MEFEALLKVAFADHGSLEGLRANPQSIRSLADAGRLEAAERMREYQRRADPSLTDWR